MRRTEPWHSHRSIPSDWHRLQGVYGFLRVHLLASRTSNITLGRERVDSRITLWVSLASISAMLLSPTRVRPPFQRGSNPKGSPCAFGFERNVPPFVHKTPSPLHRC